jgi:hypothetical protein
MPIVCHLSVYVRVHPPRTSSRWPSPSSSFSPRENITKFRKMSENFSSSTRFCSKGRGEVEVLTEMKLIIFSTCSVEGSANPYTVGRERREYREESSAWPHPTPIARSSRTNTTVRAPAWQRVEERKKQNGWNVRVDIKVRGG